MFGKVSNCRIMIVALLFVMLSQVYTLNTCAQQIDLTGLWNCDEGGLFYIRQIGDGVWWYGEQSSTNPSWSNVAEGRISDNMINLNWIDVPKGSTMNSGILVLNIISNNQLTVAQKTGDFKGSEWTRSIEQKPLGGGFANSISSTEEPTNTNATVPGYGFARSISSTEESTNATAPGYGFAESIESQPNMTLVGSMPQ